MGKTKTPSVMTVSGVLVDLMTPDPLTILWSDIAHALAHQCRFNGHTRVFYSVAEHSFRVSQYVPAADALWGLVHDAAEAYIGDVVSPVKRLCPELYEVERRLLDAIAQKLDLPADMPESVLEADARMLATEARDMLPDASWCKATPYPVSTRDWLFGRKYLPMTPDEARTAWLGRLRELTGGRHV